MRHYFWIALASILSSSLSMVQAAAYQSKPNTKAAAEKELSEKYGRLRTRFLETFYFQGRVAEAVDPSVRGGRVVFADQTIYMGQALLVFSTEMAILKAAGQDPTDARNRIKEILDAIDELDQKANERFGAGGGNTLDGLFVRDDITGPDDPRLGGRFVEVRSDFQNPERENDSPSGDQIFGLMYGLYGVVHYTGDDELIAQAQAISSRLYDYARRTFFILRLPNGEATRRGSDMRWLASLLHGLNKAITGRDLFNESRIEVAGFRLPLNGIASFWDSENTPDTIAEHAGESITIPIINQEFELNSFALHIVLMAIAPSEVWSQDELEEVAVKCNHHLSVLLHCQAHRSLPHAFDEQAIRQILAACPDDGPRASLPPETGWQRDNRWIRCTNIFEPNEGNELYNGLDWLLLHNFHHMIYSGPRLDEKGQGKTKTDYPKER